MRPGWGRFAADLGVEMAGRTVKPDGKKIKALRIARGMNLEEFAWQTECSESTLKSIEAGKPCFVYTIDKIAKKFLVPTEELLAAEEPRKEPERKRIRLEIKMDVSFAEFDETAVKMLVMLLQKFGIVKHEVELAEIYKGSVVIILVVDESDLYRLIAAYRDGDLAFFDIADLRISEARLPDGSDWLSHDQITFAPGTEAGGQTKAS